MSLNSEIVDRLTQGVGHDGEQLRSAQPTAKLSRGVTAVLAQQFAQTLAIDQVDQRKACFASSLLGFWEIVRRGDENPLTAVGDQTAQGPDGISTHGNAGLGPLTAEVNPDAVQQGNLDLSTGIETVVPIYAMPAEVPLRNATRGKEPLQSQFEVGWFQLQQLIENGSA